MPSNLPDLEFEAIRAVMTQTRRGQLFLEEYVRRRRLDDAARLLAAVERFDEAAPETQAAGAALRLAEALGDLRPLAETLADAAPRRASRPAGLERRFAALVELGENDVPDVRRIG